MFKLYTYTVNHLEENPARDFSELCFLAFLINITHSGTLSFSRFSTHSGVQGQLLVSTMPYGEPKAFLCRRPALH